MSEINGPVRVEHGAEYATWYVNDANGDVVVECEYEVIANTIRDALNAQEKLRADLADAIKRIPPTGNDYFGNDNTAKMYMDKCADLYELESRHAEAVRLLEALVETIMEESCMCGRQSAIERSCRGCLKTWAEIDNCNAYLESEKGESNATS